MPDEVSDHLTGGHAAAAQEMILAYRARYLRQSDGPDHLLDVLALGDGRAIVSGNLGLVLVDLAALPPGGTQEYLHRLRGLNARDVCTADGRHFYVNLNRGGEGQSPGLAVVVLESDTLRHLRTLDEPGVLYEKMAVVGGYLYVAAHAHGLHVFSLADPEAPALVGELTSGLSDTWAVAVDGATAYVADGGAGLKLVDVSDPAHPFACRRRGPGHGRRHLRGGHGWRRARLRGRRRARSLRRLELHGRLPTRALRAGRPA